VVDSVEQKENTLGAAGVNRFNFGFDSTAEFLPKRLPGAHQPLERLIVHELDARGSVKAVPCLPLPASGGRGPARGKAKSASTGCSRF
jgi:hypothetical protein